VKIGGKFAEDIASDIYDHSKKKIKELYQGIVTAINVTMHNARPLKKPLEIIFEIPGIPYIELHAKADNVEPIAKGISASRLAKIHKRIAELSQHITIDEVHFSLGEKGQWQFTYLITPDGMLIGTKPIFKKRDKLVKRIELSPTKGFSIGADVTYSDLEDNL
jgi:hypothetical protein